MASLAVMSRSLVGKINSEQSQRTPSRDLKVRYPQQNRPYRTPNKMFSQMNQHTTQGHRHRRYLKLVKSVCISIHTYPSLQQQITTAFTANSQTPRYAHSDDLVTHQSPHASSSFFFFIALVPIPLGFFCAPMAPVPRLLFCDRVSPALENSSQKSFFSAEGPEGGAPNESQKSFFSGSTLRFPEEGCSSPSTKRVNAVPAAVVPVCMFWPTIAAVLRACAAMSASESCVDNQQSYPFSFNFSLIDNVPSGFLA